MAGPIRILIVDDHALVRDMLAVRLNRENEFQVIGSADRAERAIEMATDHEPCVIIMDIDMPGLDSFNAARVILSRVPSTRILFLSAFGHDGNIEQAMAAGARGFVTKGESPDGLIQAIRDVANGGSFYSAEIQARIVARYRTPAKPHVETRSTARISTLTAREREVLKYIAQGMSKKEAARVMHVSVKTVERHTSNLMDKLDIRDRVELARFAIRERLVEP